MRILVLTNQFAEYGGSEIVALEIARWFSQQGDEVTLGANHIAAPLAAHAEGIALTPEIGALELGGFDFIWCQHDLLTLFPVATLERAAQEGLPRVALVSLSPYELYEHVDAWLARAVAARVFANSEETGREIVRRGHGKLSPKRVRVFHNAAPREFWCHDAPAAAPADLKSVTLISNHAPPELVGALAQLKRRGIGTRHIGMQHEARLVRPEDIAEPDAIVTVGKSALYAIAQNKPVYMYDHFGGEGWLTRANFDVSLAHNFSGRPACRRLSSDAIVREIIENFAETGREARRLRESIDLRPLSLDYHLCAVRRRIGQEDHRGALSLRRHLARADFRAHLETLNAKSSVMKRSYLAAKARQQAAS